MPTPVRDPDAPVDSRPPPITQPVDLWEGGRVVRQIDGAKAAEEGYVVLDLGEAWTPYLFTEKSEGSQEHVEHGYRDTYLALARGEFPDDHHGRRAREDKYLELYGILPTLGLLRARFHETANSECAKALDLEPLRAFDGMTVYQSNDVAKQQSRQFEASERQIAQILERHGASSVDALEALPEAGLRPEERDAVRLWKRIGPRGRGIKAAQERLICEGILRRTSRVTPGALDWYTREALAEFERKHRIYGWGYFGRETLDALRRTPAELDHESVIRVLTERAVLAAGFLEDGSTATLPDGTPRTYRGMGGRDVPIRNLAAETEEAVREAFGLKTPEATLAWLDSLGPLEVDQNRFVAFKAPERPEYYAADMDLSVEIDRGDVWYEFPYDDEGREKPQGVSRRPHQTVFVQYNDQRIPIARFGTTIGGWRSEWAGEQEAWRYKNSPPGPRVWTQIVAAPVWLPPESTPPRSFLARSGGSRPYVVNYHETGPSYASAYGLVAAYHYLYNENEDGSIRILGDEGIRTHGSVDYMSIMRRHSHGCHRLHNHIAVRLMSFVLAHRPHQRLGEQPISFRRDWLYEGHTYTVAIDQGGYRFVLDQPIKVQVLPGRILGSVGSPIEIAIPKYDTTRGGYFLQDGSRVLPRGNQLIPAPMLPDAGVPMGAPGAATTTSAAP